MLDATNRHQTFWSICSLVLTKGVGNLLVAGYVGGGRRSSTPESNPKASSDRSPTSSTHYPNRHVSHALCQSAGAHVPEWRGPNVERPFRGVFEPSFKIAYFEKYAKYEFLFASRSRADSAGRLSLPCSGVFSTTHWLKRTGFQTSASECDVPCSCRRGTIYSGSAWRIPHPHAPSAAVRRLRPPARRSPHPRSGKSRRGGAIRNCLILIALTTSTCPHPTRSATTKPTQKNRFQGPMNENERRSVIPHSLNRRAL